MPISTIAQQAGVYGRADLDLLSRAYSQAASHASNEEQRMHYARATIALFRSGVTDEATLVRMVSRLSETYSTDEPAFAHASLSVR